MKSSGSIHQIYSRTGGFMDCRFAIPIELAVNVADQLRDSGSVHVDISACLSRMSTVTWPSRSAWHSHTARWCHA